MIIKGEKKNKYKPTMTKRTGRGNIKQIIDLNKIFVAENRIKKSHGGGRSSFSACSFKTKKDEEMIISLFLFF